MPLIQDIFFLSQGILSTLSISFISFILGFSLGVPVAITKQLSRKASTILEVYDNIMRGIPVLVIMLFLHFGLAAFIPIFRDPFISTIIALGLRSCAFQSQIFRGAMNSVSRDQMLAAVSLGMTKMQIFRHIIIPQAFIVALPGLGSEIALLIKDSSYSFVLGVLDLAKYADILRAAQKSFYPYLLAAAIYVAITLPIASYLDRLGSALKTKYGLR
ncbi:MAG: amino acid ABC transporter permease [Candidatus Methanodesulfokora sp.]